MKIIALLNRDGGTLKNSDVTAVADQLRASFEGAGHSIDCRIIAGSELENALANIAREEAVDCLLAGGGDGTVSAAAATAWRCGKVLGVLPAGTMNLFARSLNTPLEIESAIDALADGQVRHIDIATANGKPFVHQYSVGFHARAVSLRDKMQYGSRYGKMLAGLKAIWLVIRNPPSFRFEIDSDCQDPLPDHVSALAVSNNIFGTGHLPYADELDAGKLGIYCTDKVTTREAVGLVFNVVTGNIHDDTQITLSSATRAKITFSGLGKNAKALIDGELVKLEKTVELEIHPQGLRVLAPITAGGVTD